VACEGPNDEVSEGFSTVVYYESIKRELKIKPVYMCRCDGRLQTKRFTRLSYTGRVGRGYMSWFVLWLLFIMNQ
jgi:hypothetical protein